MIAAVEYATRNITDGENPLPLISRMAREGWALVTSYNAGKWVVTLVFSRPKNGATK